LVEKHSLAQRILETVNKLLVRKGLMLKQGTIVEAAIIAVSSSTKNDSCTRDPDIHQRRKGKQWFFGMKVHVGSDSETGLVHAVEGTRRRWPLSPSRATCCTARKKWSLRIPAIRVWHVAIRPGKRRALGASRHARILDQIERIKAQVRAKGEHAFRVVRRQFSYIKVRYRGLAKNTAQLCTLFALANLWTARRALVNMG
jgi:IS5 family transposase